MTSIIDQFAQFVSAHPWLAYAAVFAAALLEAVPLLGSFVPGSSLIIALSALVAAGELSLTGMLASTITGAVIGDGAAFLLGAFYKRRILTLWPLSIYPNIVARSETFVRRYGALAILFARFVPPVRALPVTAGALGMPPSRFFAVNIPAIGLWACAHVLPGALAGTLWMKYGRDIEHIVLPLIALAVVIWVVVWVVRRRKRRGIADGE